MNIYMPISALCIIFHFTKNLILLYYNANHYINMFTLTDENSKTEADCVTKYIQSKSPIIQGLEERIRFVNTIDGEM